MSYLPIEEHGVIGDLHSVALVGTDGTIDWCCLPHFDSPSVFASILDSEKGGQFKLFATSCINQTQMYHLDSNVLITRSFTKDGLGQIEDFMPIPKKGEDKGVHQIIRRLTCVRGEIEYQLDCQPAFDYAKASHSIKIEKEGAVFETQGDLLYSLSSPVELKAEGSAVKAKVTLKEGEVISFIFFCAPKKAAANPLLLTARPKHIV